MNTKVNEGKLISGKDALIALANGDEVEWTHFSVGEWHKVPQKTAKLQYFLDDDLGWKFRLKPRTITINGIEVPACDDDYKPHTFMFVLNSLEPCEYSKIILDESDEIPPYWWSTEEEIKQVVAALRQVFGGSHDN